MGGLSDNQLRLTHNEKTNLIILNSNIDVLETYILINNHTIGSSNNNFVIYENDQNILSLNSSNIDFYQENITFSNIDVYNQTNLQDVIVNNSFKINNFDINFDNSQIFTESNIIFYKDINVNNTYTDTLFVNTIDNINGCNIIIKNLQLSESKFNNPDLINTVNIRSIDNSNVININVSDNQNLASILKVEDLFEINSKGSIIIQNNLQLNSNSLYFNNLSIDDKNCISIGKIKHSIDVTNYQTKLLWESNNASLLHIHRNDYKEYNIVKDPLLYISTEYNSESNTITQNYDKMPFIISNLDVIIDTNFKDITTPITDYTTGYELYFDFLPLLNDNIKWYKANNQYKVNNYSDGNDIFTQERGINLFINNYDYNSYKLYTKQIVSEDISVSDDVKKYKIEMYIGFYLDSNITSNIDTVIDTHKDNIDLDILTSNESIYVGAFKIENTSMLNYSKIVESNYNLFPNVSNIYIDFNIHVLYEITAENTDIYFIDLTPNTIPCPPIIHCEFNTNEILNLNSNGLLSVKDINTTKGKIEHLIVSEIDSDVNFMNCNLNNINNLELNNINVNTINAQIVNTDDINVIGGNKIVFTEIDTSNFNSDFFKYNDSRTLFLNQFTICDGTVSDQDVLHYRETKHITECLITNKDKISV